MLPKGYAHQLDSLRAFAVLAVIASHTLPAEIKDWIRPGQAGVRLFFIISGFLITGILLNCKNKIDEERSSVRFTLFAFFARRALRIFPVYYLVLFCGLVFGYSAITENAGWHFFYLSNVLFAMKGAFPYDATGPFWSLAVEEQFYIIWPFIILLCPRKSMPWILLGCLLVAPAFRFAMWFISQNTVSPLILMPSCIDSLAGGAVLALAHFRKSRHLRLLDSNGCFALAVVGLALFCCLFLFRTGFLIRMTLTDSVQVFLFALVVHRATVGFGGLPGRILDMRGLQLMGRISYGIYLYHGFVILILHHLFPNKGIPLFIATSVLTAVVAGVSWRLIELPLNRLKRRFPYQPQIPAPG